IALQLLCKIFSISIVQKYYSLVEACRCNEHEIKHICRYHCRRARERELECSQKEVSRQFWTRKASKDIYIEVSPGTYSVTATSEDMIKQTHVVDINAGQSVDLTFDL
ncbi:AKIP1 protein, partial [Centropus bengalensis]|nr:AKIP1 protein [Centropus bengalensis]